jgi:hypothetical protein
MILPQKYGSFLPLFFILLLACKMEMTNDIIDEGIITYDIIYFETEQENPLISLLPTDMTITFKDDKAISVFEGWMGIFSSCLITDIGEEENMTLIKLSDKKYYYVSDINEPVIGNEYDSIIVKNFTDTKNIAGFDCQKSNVSIIDSSSSKNSSFDIFYTNEIKLKYPNINSPFKNIDGILMEFQMEINNIEMKLVFNNIKQEKIPDSAFNVPEGYNNIDRDKMKEILNSVSFD